MKKQTNLTVLEVLLLILAAFLGGAIAGFFMDSFRKRIVRSAYYPSKEQREADFRDDLAMEMGELR